MRKLITFLVLFVGGMLVFFVGGYWTAIPTGARSLIKSVLPVVLLVLTLLCNRVERWRHFRDAALALLAASCGFLVSWWLSAPLLSALGMTTNTVAGLATHKLVDAVLIVVPALLVAWLGGFSGRDMYLRRGKLRVWLIVGLATFAVFTVLFLLQVAEQGIATARLLAWTPWILIFIFANAFMEELHFRGLLLRPFAKLIGRHPANICIALFFTLIHAPVQYTPDILQFLAVLFVLALAWGFLIQKTESLWGSVWFHAGADLMIMVGILRTHGAA
jgi:membrane protease YdiL (CAAX protease family)